MFLTHNRINFVFMKEALADLWPPLTTFLFRYGCQTHPISLLCGCGYGHGSDGTPWFLMTLATPSLNPTGDDPLHIPLFLPKFGWWFCKLHREVGSYRLFRDLLLHQVEELKPMWDESSGVAGRRRSVRRVLGRDRTQWVLRTRGIGGGTLVCCPPKIFAIPSFVGLYLLIKTLLTSSSRRMDTDWRSVGHGPSGLRKTTLWINPLIQRSSLVSNRLLHPFHFCNQGFRRGSHNIQGSTFHYEGLIDDHEALSVEPLKCGNPR
ncbi:hypothetical protein K2173_013196 [Erythroxylum novogranatense]|uniref:Uncharacterized protein n=1 Tax=Erythroxylum novogranatense TaxID=1862640 RepID=A0AAV8THJ3_9ROSI|nr:hypothetical protein K2173_013196 [Erythroxylum novogranatense]